MGRHQRKALVVLSDGGDTSSRLNLDQVLDLIRKSNATIHTMDPRIPRADAFAVSDAKFTAVGLRQVAEGHFAAV